MAIPSLPPTLDVIRGRRAEILEVAGRHHACNVRVIGSVARGDTDPASDLDLLVDMDPERQLTGFVYFGEMDELATELTRLLGVRVDIVDAGAFAHSRSTLPSQAIFRDNVLRDAVAL